MDFDYIKTPGKKDSYVCTPQHFCFVGPRGVGKTSLLASMFHELTHKKLCDDFIIDTSTPDGLRTLKSLSAAKKAMLDMIYKTDGAYDTIDDGLGIKGLYDERIYEFMGKTTVKDDSWIARKTRSTEKEFRFIFHFTDMPGGWYDSDDEAIRAKVRQYLTESSVSFLAIDTPPLMESPAHCHDLNKADIITSWYENALDTLSERGHTVIMVLTRCERYWSKKAEMLERLRSTYDILLRKLNNKHIRVYATYVKTLGGVEFEKFETKQTGATTLEVARFRRNGSEYSPENCATPLQLALKHGLMDTILRLKDKKNGFFTSLLAKCSLNNIDLVIQAAGHLADELDSKICSDGTQTHESMNSAAKS